MKHAPILLAATALACGPAALATGERALDALANGAVRLGGMDVAAAAGTPLVAVSREFEVTVTDGLLDLRFVPGKGNAIVSAVSVRPVPQGSPS